jgi:hypothetical protein
MLSKQSIYYHPKSTSGTLAVAKARQLIVIRTVFIILHQNIA